MISLITAQEHSSAKQKEIWKTIQIKAGNGAPVQLILNMKVQWSSTYLMLDHTERNKDVSSKLSLKMAS
jgi:hypothetical protein